MAKLETNYGREQSFLILCGCVDRVRTSRAWEIELLDVQGTLSNNYHHKHISWYFKL